MIRPVAPPIVSTLRRQLEESFPLLFFGVACFVMSAISLTTNTHLGGTRYPLWVLFLALGSIAAAGGTASMLSEDDVEGFLPSDLDGTGLVAIPRSELEALRRASGTAEASAHGPTESVGHRVGKITAGRTRGADYEGSGGLDPAARLRPWKELESDEDLFGPEPVPAMRFPPMESAPDGTLKELDDLAAELAPRATSVRPPGGFRSRLPPTGENDVDARALEAAGEFTGRAALLELGFPAEPPDLADSWLDPAQLPPEFAQLLAEIYPPDRLGAPLTVPRGPVTAIPAPVGRCANCSGRLRGVLTECAVCHRSLCRSCGSIALLTADKAVCDDCSRAGSSPVPGAV